LVEEKKAREITLTAATQQVDGMGWLHPSIDGWVGWVADGRQQSNGAKIDFEADFHFNPTARH